MAVALYLDDSDSHGAAPVVVLGGCLTTVPEWEIIESEARRIFKSEGIDYLRAHDFFHSRRQFEGWEYGRKRKFVDALFDFVQPRLARGYLFGTLKGRYDARRSELGVNRQMSSTGFCLWGIVDLLAKDSDLQAALAEHNATISLMMESDQQGVGIGLQRWVEYIRRTKGATWLGPMQLVDKHKSPGANIADFLAYFSVHGARAPKPKRQDLPDWYEIAFRDLGITQRLATDWGV